MSRRRSTIEVERQIEVIENGGKIVQETRLYDANKDETRSMRAKEEANDYRYFPDPDLLPVELDDAFIEQVRATLPELPDAKKLRFVEQYDLIRLRRRRAHRARASWPITTRPSSRRSAAKPSCAPTG